MRQRSGSVFLNQANVLQGCSKDVYCGILISITSTSTCLKAPVPGDEAD